MMAAIDPHRTTAAPGPELWLALPAEGVAPLRRVRQPERRLRDALLARMQRAGLAAAPGAGLTHSAGTIACATTSAGVVGIDLEWLWPRDVLRLARFAFSSDEHRWLASVPSSEQGLAFLALWVLKESAAKALGLPLMTALAQCRFSVAGSHISAQLPRPGAWRARLYAPRPALRLAWLQWQEQSAAMPAGTLSELQCKEWLCEGDLLRPADWPLCAQGHGVCAPTSP
jgi:hypothetical protein